MSENRTTLQQHNIRINENNSDLSSILEEINNLPLVDVPILQDKNVVPTTETQEIVADDGYTGLSKVTVEKITGDTLEVTPGTEQQNFSGVYTDVKVAGDENLVAENIKKDVEIFGVVGSAEGGGSTFKINDASNLFNNGARLDIVNELLGICENVISAERMFYGCGSLEKIDLSSFDTSNSVTLDSMFYNCVALTELDLSSFDTSKVILMNSMFNVCRALTKLDLSSFDTSNVTNMNSMFAYCVALTKLDLSSFDTSNVTNMNSMFNYCQKLSAITELNAGKVTSMGTMFGNCTNLVNFGGLKDIGKAYTREASNYSSYKYDLSKAPLNYESLLNVINNLYDLNLTYDVANGGTLYTQQLVLGSTNMAKLSADEIAIATNKGWTVS